MPEKCLNFFEKSKVLLVDLLKSFVVKEFVDFLLEISIRRLDFNLKRFGD
jgi:hypothetical protein